MRILNKKAVSIIEYAVLFIIVIGAYLIMRNYIQNGFYSSWEGAGQGFAFGRQYDARKTIECSYDPQSNQWYDHNCYEYYLNNTPPACSGGASAPCSQDTSCEECVIIGYCWQSSSSYCYQLNNGAML